MKVNTILGNEMLFPQANEKPQKLNQKFAMAEQKGTRTTDVKSSYLSEQEKEEIGVGTNGDKSSSHDKETHGTSDDISENTSVDEVKGPSVFARAKEEIEAVVGSILPKK
ncbi:hypothetical protein ACJIZ3_020494 [Penstemon smallii]|uniref:Uncharacterized protein n=1 Tax=Penstemon smallii TaxID=265156 RepID=A0ABD3SIR7_9LAMI